MSKYKVRVHKIRGHTHGTLLIIFLRASTCYMFLKILNEETARNAIDFKSLRLTCWVTTQLIPKMLIKNWQLNFLSKKLIHVK